MVKLIQLLHKVPVNTLHLTLGASAEKPNYGYLHRVLTGDKTDLERKIVRMKIYIFCI